MATVTLCVSDTLLCLLAACVGCCSLQHNGRYISDNRMNFIFGTSERGSLEKAFDALQAELDALGVSDGLTRQQVGLSRQSATQLVAWQEAACAGYGHKYWKERCYGVWV